jgi:Spy/CpxP family protein refolding chaperone
MRKLTLTLAAASALITMAAVSTPASAKDYPYCLQGRQTGYPGECSYSSYQQCQASASGRDAFCGINPRVAYNQQRGGWNRRWH